MSAATAQRTVRRKVTASGVIWVDGNAYYVSRRLAGQSIQVVIGENRVLIDVLIPLHKEYRLRGDVGGGVPGRLEASARAGGTCHAQVPTSLPEVPQC